MKEVTKDQVLGRLDRLIEMVNDVDNEYSFRKIFRDRIGITTCYCCRFAKKVSQEVWVSFHFIWGDQSRSIRMSHSTLCVCMDCFEVIEGEATGDHRRFLDRFKRKKVADQVKNM